MKSNDLAFAAYWRNSLADADLGQGAFTEKNSTAFSRWQSADVSKGRLDDETIKQYFLTEPEDAKSVTVILRPRVYLHRLQRGKQRLFGVPTMITPLITVAQLTRNGYLYPSSTTVIPRDILSPLIKGAFSIGDIDKLDQYLTINKMPIIHIDEEEQQNKIYSEQALAEKTLVFQKQWQTYLDACNNLLKSVTDDWLDKADEFERVEYGFIIKRTQPENASKHIIALYDHLIKTKQTPRLFTRFTATEIASPEPLLSSGAKFDERLGHPSDSFPLAPAQRDALIHLLHSPEGEILAVNGPPGTGKTTLVLSVVATLWAKAALAEEEPPVIVATSTNNQAITNIIEAFEKNFSAGSGPLAGRWLPSVNSFGAYYPSSTKKAEASTPYQTEAFFDDIESADYLTQAKAHYLHAAKKAFLGESSYSIEKVVALLHQRLQQEAAKLSQLSRCWQTLCQARERLMLTMGEDPANYIEQQKIKVNLSSNDLKALNAVHHQWLRHLAEESLFYSLFAWLAPVRNKRRLRASLFMHTYWPKHLALPKWNNIADLTVLIADAINYHQSQHDEHQNKLEAAQAIIAQERQAAQDWYTATQMLGHTANTELDFSQADELADTQIRFTIFLLTTHYWEGRWLLDMEKIQKDKGKTGRIARERRWRHRMKVTPCVVMTCFMLPAHMVVKRFVQQNQYDDDYLYDFVDLLIVDEAGQVLPEVGAAAFALAKKALVIGDTEQIPPIWSTVGSVDIGNMLAEGIINRHSPEQEMMHHYNQLALSGKTSAAGSVMRIAQLASRYQYDPELARGMYLYEHRRCVDNIIRYCNELCYHGRLLPKRGPADINQLFPAMGYLHIDGKGIVINGGSRHNLLEAKTIAAWVSANKAAMESYYGKNIADIIGIVTPFGAQVAALQCRFRRHKLSEHNITIGTVHALQGAERHIILFSPVCSKHQDSDFIDRDNSMLNVAVSRAKDSFLVFGDMDLFELQPASTPRGLLATYLFSDVNNSLQFAFIP
jgi:RecA/RadA recombinase